MIQDIEMVKDYLVEREFLGKITVVEFVENIVKKHYENDKNTNEIK